MKFASFIKKHKILFSPYHVPSRPGDFGKCRFLVQIVYAGKAHVVDFQTGGKWPNQVDILYALHIDCTGIESSPLWPDWANEYGYDENDLNAKKIFEMSVDNYIKLRRMLGYAKFGEFLKCTD